MLRAVSLLLGFGAGLLTACAAPLVFTAADAEVAYATAAGLVKDCTPRNAGTPGALRAAQWLCPRAGATATLERFRDAVNDETCDFANVVLELPGTDRTAPWIILLSHFDTAPNVPPGFQGANDGASTSGLLVALAGVLRRSTRLRHNVMLVWTDGEECRIAYGPRDGFHGSRRLLGTVQRRGLGVRAAICLDMLGDRDLAIGIPANGAPELRRLALVAARRAGLADKVSLRDSVAVKDDHACFHDAGYPALDLIDFSFGSAPGLNDYWHTPHDTLDKISAESLRTSGRLAVELLNLLDAR